ncbi:CRISPR/Cas system associated protein [Enterococcus phage EF_WCK]
MAKGLKAINEAAGKTLVDTIAEDFERQLNKWGETGFTYDADIHHQIMRDYLKVVDRNPFEDFPENVPVFRSSGTGKCLREQTLFAIDKLEGSDRKDPPKCQAHQSRWQMIGTAVGDMIQEQVLMMEKHYQRFTKEECHFRFERTEEGFPHFEEFSTTFKKYKSGRMEFITGGSMDGIMIWTDPATGEEYWVSLEVKSKQTTPAATSKFSMRQPNSKHVWQVKNYAMLKDLDMYLIVYVNCAHKSWEMTEEDYAKNPDLQVFGVDITEQDKKDVRNRFFTAIEHAHAGTLPPLELSGFTFSDYKYALANSLTYKELEELEKKAVSKFDQKALEEIKKIRGDVK